MSPSPQCPYDVPIPGAVPVPRCPHGVPMPGAVPVAKTVPVPAMFPMPEALPCLELSRPRARGVPVPGVPVPGVPVGTLRGWRQARVATCAREIAGARGNAERLREQNRRLLARLEAERAEVARLAAALASRSAQHGLETRRREQELARLKERMAERRDRRPAMELLNAVPRAGGRRGAWRPPRAPGTYEPQRGWWGRLRGREMGLGAPRGWEMGLGPQGREMSLGWGVLGWH
ncbi:E3 ubiquitin-protein ligase RNF12-B-like [Rhea pennata]|uniref:E3 ubiquitin-protein ligase RNF12-B-like n=1 Tax=Rhea pennata TaxID=8795 RepID=UPI002E276BD3